MQSKGYLGWKEVVGKNERLGDLVGSVPFKLMRVSQRYIRHGEDHDAHFGVRRVVAAAIRHLVTD